MDVRQCRLHYPPGVQRILDHGSICYIGLVDDSTVLKYPLDAAPEESRNAVQAEAAILEAVGPNDRIIGYRGQNKDGLLLEYARRGNLYDHVRTCSEMDRSERIRFCREMAEGVNHLHTKLVYHSDLRPQNLLLDDNLHLKVADIQGVWKSSTGEVIQDGKSREATRYYMPRKHGDDVNATTDLFAIGSTYHFVMTGEEVYSKEEGDHIPDDETIESRFARREFPQVLHALHHVTRKCWEGAYRSVVELLRDVHALEISEES